MSELQPNTHTQGDRSNDRRSWDSNTEYVTIPLKEDLKVVGGEDRKLPGEEDGSIIWESPKDAELRVQLIDALAGTTFGFHSSQLEAIWPLIESRLKETTLSDVERFDYNRLKSLEIGSINRYEEFTNSEPDSPKRVAAFIHQLSPWNIDRGIEALESRDQRIALEARIEGYDVNRMGSWVFIGDNKVLQNLDDLYWSYVMEQVANDSAEYDKYTLEYCKMNMEYAGFDKVGIHKMLARADQIAKERLATLKQSQKEE